MRFLKQKIARALQCQSKDSHNLSCEHYPSHEQLELPPPPVLTSTLISPVSKQQSPLQPLKKGRRIPTSPSTPRGLTSCKNIIKNYSRALAAFASSSIAVPYLVPLLKKQGLSLQEFQGYFTTRKEEIHCINRLREMLLVEAGDTPKMAAIKTVFKEISIVFLKYFSVNWVFNSRVCDKISHLNYRQKILRRVQNPVYFTYLQEFSKREAERKNRRRKVRLG